MRESWRKQRPGHQVLLAFQSYPKRCPIQPIISRSLLVLLTVPDSPQFTFLGSRPVPLFLQLELNHAFIRFFSPQTNICGCLHYEACSSHWDPVVNNQANSGECVMSLPLR